MTAKSKDDNPVGDSPDNEMTNIDNDFLRSEDVEADEVKKLIATVQTVKLPPPLMAKVDRELRSLNRQYGEVGYNSAYDDAERYIDWITNLPWDKRSEDNLDIDVARDILETTHYGLDKIKERILEYIAVLRLQKMARDDKERQALVGEVQKQGEQAFPVLFLVGLPGIGKTSIAYTVAKAMNREFIRIPMGGMGSALQLRGESRITPEAEPGQVIKGLRRAQTKNPVILLDEIDRTAEQARSQIMGVLLELLDPEQNFEFTDYFINFPFDLSEVMFMASANNTAGISNAVLDRMELIKMPGYTDDEKIVIARDYLLPRQLKITGMPPDAITFAADVWPAITRPLGYDAGIRTMSRMINSVVRKAAMRMAEGRGEKFEITNENIKEFLPSV
ncbi:AAA family ATPase [candidate division WWE3 bacterium]|uniref:AAA family ATPase n=1 Tax=candidate division WWE3 bacterium TaxID=2053526 RepID=A0A955LJT5_UNCKA|nr:AAA family ATPase [candidate division WWE3 bacterium]